MRPHPQAMQRRNQTLVSIRSSSCIHSKISMKMGSLCPVLWINITHNKHEHEKKNKHHIYKSTLRLNLFFRILRRRHNPLIVSQWATSNSPFQWTTRYNFFLPLPSYVNPFLIQQLLIPHVNIMPGVFKFYGLPVLFWSDTLYQHQHHYWPFPSSGPNRHQHGRRFRSRTEPQTSYKTSCESSGTIEGDRSTGIRPCHVWISAHFNTVVGEVWRTPSMNPFTIDRNLT